MRTHLSLEVTCYMYKPKIKLCTLVAHTGPGYMYADTMYIGVKIMEAVGAGLLPPIVVFLINSYESRAPKLKSVIIINNYAKIVRSNACINTYIFLHLYVYVHVHAVLIIRILVWSDKSRSWSVIS